MISGNGLPAATECDKGQGLEERADSKALRDIKNLIAKLEVVNRQLLVRPPRSRPAPRQENADSPQADG